MGVKDYASAMRRYGLWPRRLVPFIVLSVLSVVAGLLGGFHAPVARAASSPTTPIWSTQLFFDNNGTPWSESFFAGLAADGLTTAELNMPWATIEPEPGTFSFTEFDTELANASAAGIQLIPIFWQAGWAGSPAPWINDFEVGSGGAQGAAPTWWDSTEQSEYFTYVEDTIENAIAQPGGYGGAVLDYGDLDAQWFLNGAGGGYAASDIAEFRDVYLPGAYGTIAAFNSANGTSYTAFSQVPAAAPGQPLFGVFQAFRAWSVKTTYGQLTADVRAITPATPLYYYFGGGFGNATNYANNPDTFFQLAKQYNVTIIDDAAASQGLTLTFGSLARAYGVKVAQEWTAPSDNSQLAGQAVQWISNYAMSLPESGGEDFFIHDGTEKDTVGFPIYTSWLHTLKGLSGTYPRQPVAVYIDFSQGYGNTSGGSLSNVEGELSSLWLEYQAGFTVVTSQEVNNGAISLSQFKAVLPLNGVDTNLTAYKNAGGALLTEPEQLTAYAPAYAQIDAPDVGDLQTIPAVAASGTSASITLANITSGTTYDAPIAFSPAGLGIAPGSYYLVNAATGTALPQTQQPDGLLCATADIGAATLAQWNVVAGTPPSGTASASCPVTDTGTTSVTATAGQPGQGLNFLEVGATNAGSDGNLTQITQGGQTAEETWTTSQNGTSDANVYLQLNPLSAVKAASNVTVQVTYWATAGQSFTVQYNTPGNAYLSTPAVTSPGTGTWTTATVQLTGAQFNEAQNYGADLRLGAVNPSTPLIVQSVTMSTSGTDAPYGGTPAPVPGTVEAANYDTGGQGVGYNVTSVNGTANSYRPDGVDLEACSDTACGDDLGWTAAGQSFKYTVDVATAGTYTVSLRVASPNGVTDALHIANSAGTNLTGNINAPATGGWQDWATKTASITLPAGVQTLTLDQDNGGWNIYYMTFAAVEGPYGGTQAAIPGTVQAANYDTGGQGTAYNITSVNGTANSYRPDGVDLENTSDTQDTSPAGGAYDLGWTTAGQWFKYTVNVAAAGTYTVSLRLASPGGVTDGLHIANSAGTNLTGDVNVPNTGGWQDWTTVTASVTLPAGVQTLTVDQDTGGWNLHYLSFAAAGLNTSAWYEVVNENSGLCASAAGGGTANGTAVEQLACTGATSQQWQFVPTSVSGSYEVVNENAQSEGESWNITGGVQATASGDPLQIWNYGGTGNTNALFSATLQSSGHYTFVVDNSGLCIDTPGSSTASGVQLQQDTCNSTGAQAFSLVQA